VRPPILRISHDEIIVDAFAGGGASTGIEAASVGPSPKPSSGRTAWSREGPSVPDCRHDWRRIGPQVCAECGRLLMAVQCLRCGLVRCLRCHWRMAEVSEWG
jgi:hypothetical protein